MAELTTDQVEITCALWQHRLDVNAVAALDHQWMQLERSGCIHNFRLVAGGAEGFRVGWFFADSDAYKWLDAACRVYAYQPSESLQDRIDSFVSLLASAQTVDGYLYTYNQLHFPETRWSNLQIEHELYCFGHLIEAAISHYQATGQNSLLAVAKRAADLMVRDLLGAGPERTPGHQEIELALIKLYRLTAEPAYLELAAQFLEQRGRIPGFALHIYRQNASVEQRGTTVHLARQRYEESHPELAARHRLPEGNTIPKPRGTQLRWFYNTLTGRYFQQHRPVCQQSEPVGHAVRFAYLQTALAMLHQARADDSLLPVLETVWDRMVSRRMYPTGGLGAVPGIEGFGRDYELDPALAYAETCAALGSMFWSWQMALITHRAAYADLFEWQLYNAAGVGMGLDGCSYLYNNPLLSRGEITRQPWYAVPCCPSNLSRTWADLGRYLYSHHHDQLWVHQYIGSRAVVDVGVNIQIEVKSALPWGGRVDLCLAPSRPAPFTLNLRVPSWADGARVAVNGQEVHRRPPQATKTATGAGYDPRSAYYLPLRRTWSPGDRITLDLPLPVRHLRPHPKVRSWRGQVALARGPLVYCFESVDNPGLDLFGARANGASLWAEHCPDLLEGVWAIRGQTAAGEPLIAIPYAWWANRGPSQMTVPIHMGVNS